jgi:hypothetical protein
LIRQYGEPVTYYPGGPNHQAREIQAIVERNDPAVIAAMGDAVGQSLVLRAINDVEKGILSTEIDSGLDRISVPLTADGDPEMRSIVQILSDSGGIVRFLVQ